MLDIAYKNMIFMILLVFNACRAFQQAIKIHFFSDVTKHETSSNHPSTLNHYNTYNKYSVSDHNIGEYISGFPRIKMFCITF